MDGFLKIVLLLAVLPVFALLSKYFLPPIIGRLEQWMVRFKLKSSLPSSYYTLFNNVLLNHAGGTCRIDHIVVSPYGIFVITARQLSGSIVGSERDARWTRVLFRFRTHLQNPMFENRKHIEGLQDLLGLDASRFHSLVIVTGNARFEAPMPVNVTQAGGVLPFIQVRTEKLLGYEEAERVVGVIRSQLLTADKITRAGKTTVLKTRFQHVSAVLEPGRRR